MWAKELEVQGKSLIHRQFGLGNMSPCLKTKSINNSTNKRWGSSSERGCCSYVINFHSAPSCFHPASHNAKQVWEAKREQKISKTGPGKETGHSALEAGKQSEGWYGNRELYQILLRLWGSSSADSKALPRGLGMAAWSSFGGEAVGGVKNKRILAIQF